MGTIRILNKTGDTALVVNPLIPQEVADGEQVFTELVAHGYLAYKQDPKDENKKTKINVYDPKADVIMFPMLEAG